MATRYYSDSAKLRFLGDANAVLFGGPWIRGNGDWWMGECLPSLNVLEFLATLFPTSMLTCSVNKADTWCFIAHYAVSLALFRTPNPRLKILVRLVNLIWHMVITVLIIFILSFQPGFGACLGALVYKIHNIHTRFVLFTARAWILIQFRER